MTKSLSSYFIGVGVKRLSNVEVNTDISNQHEFNGIGGFKELFGSEKVKFKAKYLFLSDDADQIIEDIGELTWYDARENHATRTEYRLYYSTNDVMSRASEGDLVVIGVTGKESLLIVVAPAGSTIESQIVWLFDLDKISDKFLIKRTSDERKKLDYARKYIISALGFDEETSQNELHIILEKFGAKFPPTKVFSEFARSLAGKDSVLDDPDTALMNWIEKEELLFRTLEKHIVSQKLANGFGKDGRDVDEFVSYSLSVQNRRKSRAGLAFENHLTQIFLSHGIRFTSKPKTERGNEPDFVFPGIKEYNDQNFDYRLLNMLALKTTAKDRWRQILPEADRIWPKHLMTLEPAISNQQTTQMKDEKVQLIVPKSILTTYSEYQRNNIITLAEFLRIVNQNQRRH